MSDMNDLFDFTNSLRDCIDQLKEDIENFQYPTLNDSFDTEIDPEIRNDKLREQMRERNTGFQNLLTKISNLTSPDLAGPINEAKHLLLTDTVDRDNYNEDNPLGDIGLDSSTFQNAFCISFFSACCGAMLGSALGKENDSKYDKGDIITVDYVLKIYKFQIFRSYASPVIPSFD